MLDKCPKVYSCGTAVGIWTDEDMPTDIGISATVTVYGSSNHGNYCKQFTIQVEVMRCSLINNDFIYKYTGSNSAVTSYPDICDLAFCGMM